jgi:hypothetical protein
VCVLPSLRPNVTHPTFRTRFPVQKKKPRVTTMQICTRLKTAARLQFFHHLQTGNEDNQPERLAHCSPLPSVQSTKCNFTLGSGGGWMEGKGGGGQF